MNFSRAHTVHIPCTTIGHPWPLILSDMLSRCSFHCLKRLLGGRLWPFQNLVWPLLAFAMEFKGFYGMLRKAGFDSRRLHHFTL